VAVVGGGGKEVEEGTGPMCRREDGCVAVLHNSEGKQKLS
jgi:ribosomal protein L24E